MTLSAVQQAAETRRIAEADYRSAILSSVSLNGISRTATAAGVSRQAVAQLVKRAMSEDVAARERLAVLDKTWQALVKWRAGQYVPKDAAATTLWRNNQVPKRTKKGLDRLPTICEEALALAEAELLDLVEQGIEGEGFDLEVVRAELLEAETLRETFAAPEQEIPF